MEDEAYVECLLKGFDDMSKKNKKEKLARSIVSSYVQAIKIAKGEEKRIDVLPRLQRLMEEAEILRKEENISAI